MNDRLPKTLKQKKPWQEQIKKFVIDHNKSYFCALYMSFSIPEQLFLNNAKSIYVLISYRILM